MDWLWVTELAAWPTSSKKCFHRSFRYGDQVVQVKFPLPIEYGLFCPSFGLVGNGGYQP